MSWLSNCSFETREDSQAYIPKAYTHSGTYSMQNYSFVICSCIYAFCLRIAIRHTFFIPPVQIALWAHMRQFLSVCLSVCTSSGCAPRDEKILGIHLSQSFFLVFVTDYILRKKSCQQRSKVLLSVGLIANVKLHFYCSIT